MPVDEQVPQAVVVGSIAEEYDYIEQQRCPHCGGQYRVVQQSLLDRLGHPYDGIQVVCKGCDAGEAFLFDIASFFGQ